MVTALQQVPLRQGTVKNYRLTRESLESVAAISRAGSQTGRTEFQATFEQAEKWAADLLSGFTTYDVTKDQAIDLNDILEQDGSAVWEAYCGLAIAASDEALGLKLVPVAHNSGMLSILIGLVQPGGAPQTTTGDPATSVGIALVVSGTGAVVALAVWGNELGRLSRYQTIVGKNQEQRKERISAQRLHLEIAQLETSWQQFLSREALIRKILSSQGALTDDMTRATKLLDLFDNKSAFEAWEAAPSPRTDGSGGTGDYSDRDLCSLKAFFVEYQRTLEYRSTIAPSRALTIKIKLVERAIKKIETMIGDRKINCDDFRPPPRRQIPENPRERQRRRGNDDTKKWI